MNMTASNLNSSHCFGLDPRKEMVVYSIFIDQFRTLIASFLKNVTRWMKNRTPKIGKRTNAQTNKCTNAHSTYGLMHKRTV